MTEFNNLTNKKSTVNPDEVSPELLDEISGGTNPEPDDAECFGFSCSSYSVKQELQ